MKIKEISLIILLIGCFNVSAQVGINTINPRGVFNIDGKGDNLDDEKLTLEQQANDIVVTAEGNIGVGTISPTSKVHIVGIEDPLRMEGIKDGDIDNDYILVADDNGVVKKIATIEHLSIPRPTVFRLENQLIGFLSGITVGGSQAIPMSKIINSISGLIYNSSTSTITFPPGIYQMTFIYEAVLNSNCTVSSYFVDFPLSTGSSRIHSTASHNQGSTSNHGGSITYITILPESRTWQIRLGRGQSGNCYPDNGISLRGNSTQLLIFRIGDTGPV